MKISIFTSNQPRHLALIESMAQIAESTYVIQESNTLFPGRQQGLYERSPVMQRYFERVMAAEREVFGGPRFSPPGASQLILRAGDLNLVGLDVLQPALNSDVYIVFGATFIKGALCDFLIDHRACNIHMGISPQYRGSSCNFWALYDGRPGYVGGTVHLLGKGLDSGAILFHALPKAEEEDPFVLGMKAVRCAHHGLAKYLAKGALQEMAPVQQEKEKELRYSRYADFTDEVAEDYLNRLPSPHDISASLASRDFGEFVRPYVE